jgi:ATP-dependent Clp protease ATP-binding subunit ClpC
VNRIETLQNLIRKICLRNLLKVPIMLSQEEARRMDITLLVQNNFIRCYWTKTWNWSESFKEVKVTLKKARKEIELYIGRGLCSIGNSFTSRAKRVLEMAVHEGKDLGQNFVGTEHILLALIAESDGVAMRTLDKLNVDIHKLRNLILTYIEETQEEILRPLTQAEKF